MTGDMTDTPQATRWSRAAWRNAEARVIATMSAAHFVSHYYVLILAPLFAVV